MLPSPTGGTRAGAFQILISYSHDDEAQRARVLKLAQRLRDADLDVGIDRMVPMPPEGWPDWMEAQIKDARGVVIAVNPGWHRRATGAEDNPTLGRGVAWEWRLLRNLGYAAKGDPRRVLWASTAENASFVPTEVNHRQLHVYDPEHHDAAAFDALVRDLLGLPEVVPRKLPVVKPLDHGFDFQWDVYLSYPNQRGVRAWVDDAFRPYLEVRLEAELGHARVYDPWHRQDFEWTGRRKRALTDSRVLLALWTGGCDPIVDAERRSFRAREQALGIDDDPDRAHLILPVRWCGPRDAACPPRYDLGDLTAVTDVVGSTQDHINLRKVVQRIATDLAGLVNAAAGWHERHPILNPGQSAPTPIPALGSIP